ncbi:hypothetical protein CCMSSC00406_0004362 [Pleurotus cornucopiae]|uniref:Uncharacterized protein n=1 Tax=Pleurotus cornucopiae TaxID=5321 RepID=A0ACB7J0E0_PLECO|nr:hypothetical protein CCMSSC00406_0004362 [Pleurotus cornucopiae]
MSGLREVLEGLSSAKIKDRQESFSTLRRVFADDTLVATFHITSKGETDTRAWLAVFQAVFAAVKLEKILYKKKEHTSTVATVTRRLEEAAAFFRWLVERSVTVLNKRATFAVLDHIRDYIEDHGALFTPLSADYVKALRCLLEYRPHLDHVEAEKWIEWVALAFNVVLGEDLRQGLTYVLAEESVVNEAMSVDDPDDEDELPTHGLSPLKKRKRGQSAGPSQHGSAMKKTPKASSQHVHRGSQVSTEQIEFMAILPILLGSQNVLPPPPKKPAPKKSTSAQSASKDQSGDTNAIAPLETPFSPDSAEPKAILQRLRRFLKLYPTDGSLHNDYLIVLSITLDRLALNRRKEVVEFARDAWPSLVGLWGAKSKALKEGLASVLTTLLPFYTANDSSVYGVGLKKLWNSLDGDSQNRWGVDSLALENLRLEISGDNDSPFATQTFKAGFGFESGQALSWVILQLQSDVLAKLYHLSESVGFRIGGKRQKTDNPLSSLLSAITRQPLPSMRAHRLQLLLFFISRHWSRLHRTFQCDVFNTLTQYISFDDVDIQSWVYLCLAAIAYTEGFSAAPVKEEMFSGSDDREIHWDPIWTHAMRRASVPLVCRAACHIAYILIIHSVNSPATTPPDIALSKRQLLSSQRVLGEIEVLVKDIDVQGPSLPYDSVCRFCAECLKVASQDVRLYRMHLEDKVLNWLVDCWKPGGISGAGASGRRTSSKQSRVPLHALSDVMMLLEAICGLTKKSDFLCSLPLPQCWAAATLVDQVETSVIRDFVLDSKLPPFQTSGTLREGDKISIGDSSIPSQSTPDVDDAELVQPRSRDRKLSAFFVKFLEPLVAEWELSIEENGYVAADAARRSIDFATVSVCYEYLLNYNGVRPNRRVVQLACKVCRIASSLLITTKWSEDEKADILRGLEPLWDSGFNVSARHRMEAMLLPGFDSGINSQVLRSLTSKSTKRRTRVSVFKDQYRRLIWRSADVQDAFGHVSNFIRTILRTLCGELGPDGQSLDQDDVSDLAQPTVLKVTNMRFPPVLPSPTEHITKMCISFLAFVPILQSTSAEATRDKDLTDLVLACATSSHPENFLQVCPALLDHVRCGAITLSPSTLEAYLAGVGHISPMYAYAKNDILQDLLEGIRDKVSQLCQWLCTTTSQRLLGSWRVRDSAACFLDRYLDCDPTQVSWTELNGRELTRPADLLSMMIADEDIRVRFRTATLAPRLLTLVRLGARRPELQYDSIRLKLSTNLKHYEHILTRSLCLGNIMIVSSAVRRGPYWHMLETCLHCKDYSPHIRAILVQVAQRLGLGSPSVLFQLYASQIAFSVREHNPLSIPFDVLGYQNLSEYAEAAFRPFTPTNLIARPKDLGASLFKSHCGALSKRRQNGIRECFGDLIGIRVAECFAEDEDPDGVEEILHKTVQTGTDVMDAEEFRDLLKQNADSIITSILHTLGDQDFTQAGPLHHGLQVLAGSKAAEEFAALNRYRDDRYFATHEPHFPINPASSVLQSIIWLCSKFSECRHPAVTFHVMQALLMEIHGSPLVNEQVRLSNALTLWVAFRNEHFKEFTLLHTLAQGATSLMVQSDLARVSQSILEWCFECYRNELQDDPCLPDILIRLCFQADDYAKDTGKGGFAKLGDTLTDWIDGQAMLFHRSPIHCKQVSRALPAWSHRLAPELAELYEAIHTGTLSEIIGDPRISSNKFRLVRRLRELASDDDTRGEQFGRADFWRLKECIPPPGQIQEEDIHAFAGLLVSHRGQVDGIGMDHPNPFSVRTKHLSNKRGPNEEGSPQNAILFSLVTMLDSGDPFEVQSAYTTLRLVASCSPTTIHPSSWPIQISQTLGHFQLCLPPPRPGVKRNLSELESEAFLDALSSFPRWVTQLAVLICEVLSSQNSFYSQLTPMLTSNHDFAEQLLPVLVHTILQDNADKSSKELLSQYFLTTIKTADVAIRCLSCVIDVVLHLRQFEPQATGVGKKRTNALGHNEWLSLDFALLAQSCITCGAYTTALLFLELAAEYNQFTLPLSAEQILFEIYSHIDEPDGFYGIKTNDLGQFLIRRFHHEGQWEKAFHFHGAAMEAQQHDQTTMDGLLRSYHSFGFNQLAIHTLQSSPNGTSSPSMSYRLGWRTEAWDLPDVTEGGEGSSVYAALRAMHRERDFGIIRNIVRKSMLQEVNKLRGLGIENHAEIHSVIQNLMCLDQVRLWEEQETQRLLALQRIDDALVRSFTSIDTDMEFSDLENIMSTRVSLIRSVRYKEERSQIGTMRTPFLSSLLDFERACLLRLSEAARQSHQGQIALNAITRAQRLETTTRFPVLKEFAQVIWLQKEENAAVRLLRELWENKESSDPLQEAMLLAHLGTWTSDACLEKPVAILEKYFTPAVKLIQKMNFGPSDPARADVYYRCAMFAERQYRTICASPDGEERRARVEQKRREVETRRNLTSKSPALQNELGKAIKLLAADEMLLEEYNSSKDIFLARALDMYSHCLACSNDFDDDAALRLCSLWFANFEVDNLQNTIASSLRRVPSIKFMFLAHQITARLSKSPNPSKCQTILSNLVLRMCKEHPYHSLYQVLCLQPSILTPETRRSSGRHAPAPLTSTQNERGAAAYAILDLLRNDQDQLQRLRPIQILFDASLQWAMHKVTKDCKNFAIPSHYSIRKILNLRAPVLTSHLPLDPTTRYESCVWVSKFDTQFTLAGGIHLPKITDCYGDDGERYKQLFKGDDDLRQDAVMEQVFELVNVVLKRDRETKRRALSVRGYKVVPLGPQAGVLEFVGNTTSLQQWLSRAHQKYRKEGEPSWIQVKDQISNVQAADKRLPGWRPEMVVPVYRSAMESFKPVMRHWFTEQHKIPTSWFAVRLRYIRSVATTSIVGHILGLGDRHASNILILKTTGELVHIDLGIAFEQGKLLAIPERVPFRMTPDMVDGMGIAGTQGVFQRCAEETLRVLREGSQVIMTVLEVFKHDPLYSWTASEEKLRNAQRETNKSGAGAEQDASEGSSIQPVLVAGSNSGNVTQELADRTLSSVARKLDKSLSVEFTVNELLAEAMDPNNLGAMFVGWSPYF